MLLLFQSSLYLIGYHTRSLVVLVQQTLCPAPIKPGSLDLGETRSRTYRAFSRGFRSTDNDPLSSVGVIRDILGSGLYL